MSDQILSVEVGQESIAALARQFSPEALAEILDAAGTDLAHIAQKAAMDATPGDGVGPTGIPRTGNARRATVADTRAADKTVDAHYAYYHWLDQGEDRRGRVMLSRSGGYQIGAAAQTAAENAADKALDKAGREIAARWAS